MQVDRRIILIVRETRLDELVARHNTRAQAKFYVESLGADFSDYVHEHDAYQRAKRATETLLREFGRVQLLDRSFLPSFIFGPDDAVVVLGQDGLVANTLKYLDAHAVVAVSPDPNRWDGVLLPFGVDDLRRLLPDVLAARHSCREITMAEVRLGDGQQLHAVNDLFIGPRSHVSAQYDIAVGEQSESQLSSGIIVSTGLGSSGWLSSIVTGATRIVSAFLESSPTFAGAPELSRFPWDAERLRFTVREPFTSPNSQATLVCGWVSNTDPLVVVSRMAEHGVIFSDGIESDYLAFNAGTTATVRCADKRGHLVV
jgi:NAD kinase